MLHSEHYILFEPVNESPIKDTAPCANMPPADWSRDSSSMVSAHRTSHSTVLASEEGASKLDCKGCSVSLGDGTTESFGVIAWDCRAGLKLYDAEDSVVPPPPPGSIEWRLAARRMLITKRQACLKATSATIPICQ